MILITPIKLEHVPRFHQTMDVVAREHPYLGLEQAPPLDWLTTQIESNIKNEHPFFIAMVDDDIVGWCSITPIQQSRYQYTGQMFLGVLATWRHRGIGKTLIKTTVDVAWKRNIQRVELEVIAKNQYAIQLYRKSGFVDEGRKRQAYFIHNQFDDILIMSQLRPVNLAVQDLAA